MTAKVMRTEAVGDGKFEAREFNCFAAVAFTSIQSVPDTLQDRCIVLPLRRATKDERPERLTLRTRGELIDIGRKLSPLGRRSRGAAGAGHAGRPVQPRRGQMVRAVPDRAARRRRLGRSAARPQRWPI